jgi:acyl carrier protein
MPHTFAAESPASDALPATSDLGAALEQRLAGIWSQVLGIDEVKGQDNFFELGGQSLMALQIVARIREQFPIEIDLSDIFEKHTLSALATHVQSRLIESVSTMPEEKVRELLTMKTQS